MYLRASRLRRWRGETGRAPLTADNGVATQPQPLKGALLKMDEKLFAELVAELIAAQSDAMAMLVTALSQQIDPGRLKRDLRQTIDAASKLPSTSAIALRVATAAMAAAQAEAMHQAKPAGGVPRPKPQAS